MNFGSIIEGGFQILGGFADHRQASVKARFLQESNKRKTEFNLRQLEKAYRENYAKNMIQYADARMELNLEYKKYKSDIAEMAQGQIMNGIDLDGSSMYNTARSALEEDYNQSLNRTIVDANIRGSDLYKEFVREQSVVEMASVDNRFQISHQKLQTQQQASMQILQGAANVATGMMGGKASSTVARSNANSTIGTMPTLTSGQSHFDNFNSLKGNPNFNTQFRTSITPPNLSGKYNYGNSFGRK